MFIATKSKIIPYASWNNNNTLNKERQNFEAQKERVFSHGSVCETVMRPGTGPVLFVLFEISFNFHAAFLSHKIILR